MSFSGGIYILCISFFFFKRLTQIGFTASKWIELLLHTLASKSRQTLEEGEKKL